MGSEDPIGKAPAARLDEASTGPVLDPVALGRLAELDPSGSGQLIKRVLHAFETSAARLRAQYDTARAGQDPAGLRLVAHTLKSSSASIGAMRLSELCAQIETIIRTGAGGDLATSLAAFDDALDEALGAVARQLQEPA